MFTALLQLFKGFHFSMEEFNLIASSFEIRQIKKGEKFIKPSTRCDYIYFIQEGLTRAYKVNTTGHEKTLLVHAQGKFITDFRAFLKQEITTLNIEALTDCTLFAMSYTSLQQLYTKIPGFNAFARVMTEDYVIDLMEELKMLQLSVTPMERYETFLELHADIIGYIPQHMVADIINVSPVHLSRLKSALFKQLKKT